MNDPTCTIITRRREGEWCDGGGRRRVVKIRCALWACCSCCCLANEHVQRLLTKRRPPSTHDLLESAKVGSLRVTELHKLIKTNSLWDYIDFLLRMILILALSESPLCRLSWAIGSHFVGAGWNVQQSAHIHCHYDSCSNVTFPFTFTFISIRKYLFSFSCCKCCGQPWLLVGVV